MGGSGVAGPTVEDAVFLNASSLSFTKTGGGVQSRYLPWYDQEEFAVGAAYSKDGSGFGVGFIEAAPWKKTPSNSMGISIDTSSTKTYHFIGAIGLSVNRTLSLGIMPRFDYTKGASVQGSKTYSTHSSGYDLSATYKPNQTMAISLVLSNPSDVPDHFIATAGIYEDFGKHLSTALDLGGFYTAVTKSFNLNLSTGFEIRTNDYFHVRFGYMDTVAPSGVYSDSSLDRKRYIFIGNGVHLGKSFSLDVMSNVYQLGNGSNNVSGKGANGSFFDTLSLALNIHLY